MKSLRERLNQNSYLFFDGGTGTILQSLGLKGGELPETWNLSRSEDIINLHSSYLEAGANILKTNTFGANPIKFPEEEQLETIVRAAVRNARTAVERYLAAHPEGEAYVALDMGPTGKLLKPLGDLAFEDAIEAFAKVVRIGANAGADCILIETMNDTYELKAAVLAAKENSSLPVFTTMAFDKTEKLLTGADPECAVAMLEGLRVDALGVNCSLGPEQLKPVIDRICAAASLPVIVNPNAGLPRVEEATGRTVFDVDPEAFARSMVQIVSDHREVCIAGGCCGTTPDHIRAMKQAILAFAKENDRTCAPLAKSHCTVTSGSRFVRLGGGNPSVIVGERINPTGKSKFKQALRDRNLDYIIGEGLTQEDNGAHILDVNVGLPEIDEEEMLVSIIKELQAVTALPLQIDTSNFAAMEHAMRIYNGKPMVNSVNGKQEIMDVVFPLVARYGGVVVALLLDENGIPGTTSERLAIYDKIVAEAAKYGIASKDIVADALTLAVSTDSSAGAVTLDTVRAITEQYQGRTILGVSNISFGLPARALLNSTFYSMALECGLSAGIINPNVEAMRITYDTFTVLKGFDPQCQNYIGRYAEYTPASPAVTNAGSTSSASSPAPDKNAGQDSELKKAIIKGLKDVAARQTKARLDAGEDSLTIIDSELVPALDVVGKAFEKGTMFLPQLLMSAEAAKSGFEVIKDFMANNRSAEDNGPKKTIILATVKGDIHDIGKNIVKVLLENYGYDVVDLGKDVPPETIVEATRTHNARLVGLSALMTTTVVNMEESIKALREAGLPCKVMVGGAVLTQEYADRIGADHYSPDAMASVHYAEKVFADEK